MEEEYLTFQRFTTIEEAVQLGEYLEQHGIAYEIEDTSQTFDPSTFRTNELNHEFRVKILQADFAAADKLLMENARQELDTTDKDHYLYEFDDAELWDVVSKPDEWNHYDYLLAQQILKERGSAINDATVEVIKKQRMQALAAPESNTSLLVVVGYFCALLGGFLGIIIGWLMLKHKKTLPNGERVHAFSEQDRNHGSQIIMLGAVAFIMWGVIAYLKRVG